MNEQKASEEATCAVPGCETPVCMTFPFDNNGEVRELPLCEKHTECLLEITTNS